MNAPTRRSGGLLPAVLLLAVLAAIAGALVLRAVRRTAGPARPAGARAGTAASRETASPAGPLDLAPLVPVLGSPEDDLPPERFSERVDGADRALRRAGCRRIVAWRLEEPVPADVELYVFRDSPAAGAFLEGRGMPPGKDEVAADGAVFLRVGGCAVQVIPDDPADAARLGGALTARLVPALVAAGCPPEPEE